MLLLDPIPRLRDQLVYLLCTNSSATVEVLREKSRHQKGYFTKQAIYKELVLLEESGIVVRAKGQYRLTLTWIFDVVSQVENLLERVSKGWFGADLIPSPGKSRSWKFRSIRNTDRLWTQLTTSIIQTMTGPVMYQSLPHPWYSFLYKDLDRQFEQAFRLSKARSYCFIGGDTYLDQQFVKHYPKNGSLCSNAPGLFKADEPTYLNVIGPYVITTYYPLKFTRAVDAYFRRIRSKSDIRSEEVLHLFENPGMVTTKVEHNLKKAIKISRKFERYFGLPLSN